MNWVHYKNNICEIEVNQASSYSGREPYVNGGMDVIIRKYRKKYFLKLRLTDGRNAQNHNMTNFRWVYNEKPTLVYALKLLTIHFHIGDFTTMHMEGKNKGHPTCSVLHNAWINKLFILVTYSWGSLIYLHSTQPPKLQYIRGRN